MYRMGRRSALWILSLSQSVFACALCAAAEQTTPVPVAVKVDAAAVPAADAKAAPQKPAGLTVQLHLYADPRVLPTLGIAGGPNGDGSNLTPGGTHLPDFWWTVGLSNKLTDKYLTESGFTVEVLDRGDGKRVWSITTTQPGNRVLEVPAGAWYSLELKFEDNGKDGHLRATQKIYDDHHVVLYTVEQPSLFQNPTTAELGEVRYSWFTNVEPNVTQLFIWHDWREEVVADKVEITNVATLYPTKVDGSLQDWSSSPAVSTGDTKADDWEKMDRASARLAKVYPLIRKEVLRMYAPPYPPARAAFLDAYTPIDKTNVAKSLFLVRKESMVAPAQDLQTPGLSTSLRELVATVAGVTPEQVEGDAVLDREFAGDWVIREGADAQEALEMVAAYLLAGFNTQVQIKVEGTGDERKVRVRQGS